MAKKTEINRIILPESCRIPNPYNIPIHNQGNKNNCTSHAFAAMLEYQLSGQLKERVIVDVDDLDEIRGHHTNWPACGG